MRTTNEKGYYKIIKYNFGTPTGEVLDQEIIWGRSKAAGECEWRNESLTEVERKAGIQWYIDNKTTRGPATVKHRRKRSPQRSLSRGSR